MSGIKRHILVDTQGFPHGIEVTTADITDRKGAIQASKKARKNLPNIQKVLVDAGYTGQPFKDAMQTILNAQTEVVKRSELNTFKVMPKRWVVERSFAWLEKARRLYKNCERKIKHSKNFIALRFINLLLNKS